MRTGKKPDVPNSLSFRSTEGILQKSWYALSFHSLRYRSDLLILGNATTTRF